MASTTGRWRARHCEEMRSRPSSLFVIKANSQRLSSRALFWEKDLPQSIGLDCTIQHLPENLGQRARMRRLSPKYSGRSFAQNRAQDDKSQGVRKATEVARQVFA